MRMTAELNAMRDKLNTLQGDLIKAMRRVRGQAQTIWTVMVASDTRSFSFQRSAFSFQ